ncbi:midasin-like isoform X2 [Dysidea avara]|uniref:midasin-like isoform X2 n=1 Tax=Dysidea avara TaxID=196820 RepID=UPI00331E4B19
MTASCITLPSGYKVALVPSLLGAVDRLRKAVKVDGVVLVEGEAGCGKSTVIHTMAALQEDDNKPCVVTLYLGEHTDAKMLVGTYQCTGVPGEFEWRPGVLTRAVLEGWWLVLEDLDQATADVVSLLLPLVKHCHLLLPGYTQPLCAANAFKLICTKRPSGVLSLKTNLLEVLEDHMCVVCINPIPASDFEQIISLLHPDLSSLADKLLYTFHSVDVDYRLCLKLCGRIVSYVSDGRTTSREEILLECLDCLLGYKAQGDLKLKLCHTINDHLIHLSKEKVEYLNTLYKPAVQLSFGSAVSIGRAYLPSITSDNVERPQFAHTRQSLVLLESVSRCVQQQEPVLLVGETGVGKTALVSYLASITGHKLIVVNMSQQSDSTDLLGGFKPVEMSTLVFPVKERFEGLFRKTFSAKKNQEFLIHLQEVYAKHQWKAFFKIVIQLTKSGLKKCQKKSVTHMINKWEGLLEDAVKMQRQLMRNTTVVFAFIEGALVEAVHQGWWILLDEVNLATPDTLQCLSSLLEGQQGSVLLPERGDYKPVARHDEFRLFACMNPATDVGKKTLPYSIRNRFTELYVNELSSNEDLTVLVHSYLTSVQVSDEIVQGIIRFYKAAKALAENKLSDGTGRKPLYSMRTLCRSLQYVAKNPCGNVQRSLYEGLCMGFLSQLKKDQHQLIIQLIKTTLPNLSTTSVQAAIPRPKGGHYVQVEGFWLPVGSEAPERSNQYVLTSSVKSNLKDIARVVTARNHPVLLQGPTSAGKTSLVQWLAKATGHKCLRINNHEHTDLQEYVGMYTANSQGQLVFQEGVLVEAMRNGNWIILDELNLAPTDVLEALNRVLDDNRELFIPETRQLVKADRHFMLFGTQNPPGLYGGRKVLSRAFRNRFVELHFDDIPSDELVTILYKRCQLPESYAKKLVAVMRELQQKRSDSVLFAGKYGLITLRDLFRWAERYRRSPNITTAHDWEQQLADDGYLILAGKVRTPTEEDSIRTTLEKHFKRTVNIPSLFGYGDQTSLTTANIVNSLQQSVHSELFSHLVWTQDLMRLAVLLGRAIQFDEPVLLVGETGCGKTTLCQLFASILGRKLYSINCHMNTEAADFLGGLRPARRRQDQDDAITDEEESEVRLFEWTDGILVHAMQDGGCLLIDEISLADDAVLERLNSVLEPERTLLVAEKGCSITNQPYEITAQQGFVLMATMNPGGDYGKKELSPALRNRFTEIWCPNNMTRDDYQKIACHNLQPCFVDQDINWSQLMVEFLHWFQQRKMMHRNSVSVRDLLSWVTFMNTLSTRLVPSECYYHGARLVFVDSLMTETGDLMQLARDRDLCTQFLNEQLSSSNVYHPLAVGEACSMEVEVTSDNQFGISPFYISKGVHGTRFPDKYSLAASGPKSNAARLLRALQLTKPVLLEGTPGVGKTSLVMALGQASGHHVVRINLSEQTDIGDLFGSDLPVEGTKKITFKWRDGPFLKALKNGDWILLDEMNLASQSVLEGLNACLDHRGEVYIPELDMTFAVQTKTRLFACQNPQYQGSGRKGLPRSFLNRFSKVCIEPLSKEDLLFIVSSLYPTLDHELVEVMITFNYKVADIVAKENYDLWEFNIRDVLRWCELMMKHQVPHQWDPGQFIDLIYTGRLRCPAKRKEVDRLFTELFGTAASKPGRYFNITNTYLQVGRAIVMREPVPVPANNNMLLLHSQLSLMELLMYCVDMGHMSILVGGSGAGKSSIVQCLAQLTGHKLVEFPMNSDTDTTELLGGFEQVNYNRDLVNLVGRLKEVISHCLCCGEVKDQTVTHKLNEFVQELEQCSVAKVMDTDKENMLLYCTELHNMMSMMSEPYLPYLKSQISDLRRTLTDLVQRVTTDDCSGQFHWVDSVLVKALRDGHWLLISNANFCSPSVLDRLNAVLEPGGVLTLDEMGSDGDHVPHIKPHPSFRLFLTMNPKYGEISRAMRNRGVELFILPEDQLDCNDVDLAALLYRDGVSDLSTSSRLIECYKKVVELKRNQAHRPPSITHLLQTAKLCDGNDGKIETSLYERGGQLQCTLDIGPSSLPDHMLIGRDNTFTIQHGHLRSITTFTTDPTTSIAEACLGPLLASVKCQHDKNIIRAHLMVYMITTGLNDYPTRLAVLDQVVADHRDVMVDIVKAYSNAVLSSDLMCQLQQQISDIVMDYKLSLSIELDPVMQYLVKENSHIYDIVLRIFSLARVTELHQLFQHHTSTVSTTLLGSQSLLQLSHAAYVGKLSMDCLPDINLVYIYPLLKQLYDNLVGIDKCSTTNVLQFFRALNWLEIFQDYCCQPVQSDFSTGLFATVWSIWHHYSMDQLSNTVLNWKLKGSKELANTLHHLEVFSNLFSTGWLLCTIRNKLGHPSPYVCGEVAQAMVKLNEVASQLLNSTRQCSVPQSVIKIKSQLLGYYQIVWSCNHHQQALPKELFADVKELMMPTDLLSPSSNMEGAGLVLQPLIQCSLVNVLTTVYEALNKNDVTGVQSVLSDINKTLQYLLSHTTTSCSQLRPLSILSYYTSHNSCTSDILKDLLPSLFYSYTSGLQDFTNTGNISDNNNSHLYQYRSVFTEYCLDKLSVHQCIRPSEGGVTLNNRLECCEELKQLLGHLWWSSCSDVIHPGRHQNNMVKFLYQQFLCIIVQLVNVCIDINLTAAQDIKDKVTNFTITNGDIHKIIAILTSQTKDAATNELFKDAEKCLSNFIVLHEKCLSEEQLSVQTDLCADLQYMLVCEKMKTYLSLAQLLLYGPMSPVDYVMCDTVKHDCLQHVIDKEKCLLLAYDHHYRSMTGNGIFNQFDCSVDNINDLPVNQLISSHSSVLLYSSLVQEVYNDLCELNLLQQSDCQTKSVYRPSSYEYSRLVQLCKDIIASTCSSSNITTLLSSTDYAINKVAIWRGSVISAINKLSSDYPMYPDVMLPLVASLMGLVNGVSTSVWIGQQLSLTSEQKTSLSVIGSLLGAPVGLCSKLKQCISKMSKVDGTVKSSIMEYLLRACFDHITGASMLTQEWSNVTSNVLKHFACVWKLSEEAARKKDEAEASLYKYKSHTHIIEEDNDLAEIANNLFPDYDKEFGEDSEETESMDYNEEQQPIIISDDVSISYDTIVEVCLVHVLSSNSQVPFIAYHNPLSSSTVAYQLASSLYKELNVIPGMTIEQYGMGSHVLVCSNIFKRMESTTLVESSYNIYTDPNVAEVIKSCPILKTLIQSTDSLLDQWPDHPVLNQIKESAVRVLSLPVNVPVMKVLSGLEYILKKAQDWETYASSKVSLMVHLDEITQLVIEWRRKELSQWKNLLSSCKVEAQKTCSKWWFHLYHLLQECDPTDEESFSSTCQAIQKFMEWSSLGEYTYRLAILGGFASDDNTIDVPHTLQTVIWNTQQFYQQFITSVDQAIEKLSLPIVKEFKEYLTIVRWNDGTYWALKTKTDKSKRVLAKLTTKYKEVLQQPANLVITDNSLTSESVEGDSSKLQLFYESFISSIPNFQQLSTSLTDDASFPVTLDPASNDPDVTTLSSIVLISRLHSLVEESMSSRCFVEIITSIDDLTGTIINTVTELSQTAYIHELPKDKQTAAAKSNIVQKQKALSDLFKALKTIGLSYRKGLKTIQNFQSLYFTLPILECHVLSDKISALLLDGNSYYFKCIARHKALSNITTPSQRLTLGQLSRCKGFAGDILQCVTKQRFLLANLLKNYECLSSIQSTMDSLCASQDGEQQVFSAVDSLTWMEDMYQCFEELLVAVNHCKQLLETVPLSSEQASLHLSSCPPFLDTNGHEVCQTCTDKLKAIADDGKAALLVAAKRMKFSRHHKMLLSTTLDGQYLLNGYTQLSDMVNTFLVVKHELLGTTHSHIGVFQFIKEVTDHITERVTSFQHYYNDITITTNIDDDGSDGVDELTSMIRSSFSIVLIECQGLIKQYKTIQTFTMESDEDDDHIEHWEEAYNVILEMAGSSSVEQVCSSLNEVITTLEHTFSHSKVDPSTLPLVHQLHLSVMGYSSLVHKLVMDLLASHRTMCKLSSVLFAVFATLFTKGFCAEDLNVTECEGEGATEFVDVEGGGFDEGTGTTNVSKDCQDLKDQLENATQKPEDQQQQQQQDNNTDDDNEGVEMSEDFEGTLTDLPEQEEDDDDVSDKEDNQDDEDVADQMGDLGKKEREGLDKNMWAPEDQEEENELSEAQDNVDGGTEIEGSNDIVAKDDSLKKHEETNENDQTTDGNDKVEFEEQDPQDFTSAEPIPDEQYNPQDIEDLPDTDLHLDDEDIAGDDDVDEIEEMGKLELDHNEDDHDSGEETEQTIQDRDLVQEDNDEHDKAPDESDWQPDMTSVSTSEQANNIDDKTANDANTETQQSQEKSMSDKDNDNKESHGNTESTSLVDDTMDTSEDVQFESQKQRKSSDRRTLADDDQRPVKKPRIVNDDLADKEPANSSEIEQLDDGTYKHIEDEQDVSSSATVWDAATKEQQQQQQQQQPKDGKSAEMSDNEDEDVKINKDRKDESLQVTGKPSNKKANNIDNVTTPEEDSESSDIEEEKKNSDHHNEDNKMDVTQSYYHTDTSLLNVDRINPGTEELTIIKQQVADATKFLHSVKQSVDTAELWLKYESLTMEFAHLLYERIRLTFQPTQASQLKGDYKSGKRLNMKRIIPYIASHYQNDRIWLRRSKPSKMHYQLLIAIDDSSSMQDNECKQTAYESLAVISGALSRLDGAQLGICRFGSEVDVLHNFSQQFTTQTGAFILEQMSFQQPKTNFVKLMEVSRALFIDNAQHSAHNTSGTELHQLLMILSDGRGVFAEGTLSIQLAVRKLQELGVFVVFIILDPLHKDSILDIRVPIFTQGQPISFKSYLDVFPFPFYLLLKEIRSMPLVLGDALQQWFQLINDGHYLGLTQQ